MKNGIITIGRIALGIALMACFQQASAQDEAYLGVSGYITKVSKCVIIETTTLSSYSSSAPSSTMGFKIKSVQSGSPAYSAGLRSGDVLIEAEGIFINSYSSLSRMRRKLAQADSMQVFYLRHGEVHSTTVGGSETTTTTYN